MPDPEPNGHLQNSTTYTHKLTKENKEEMNKAENKYTDQNIGEEKQNNMVTKSISILGQKT